MSGAGYSGTPLHRKLGIAPGSRLALLGAPAELELELPDGVSVATRAGARRDVIVLFATRRAELERRLPAARRALEPAGGLWVAWPKRSSGVPTDLDENLLREIVLPTGMVDNKVCAIDDVWSGLRFVVRLENRR